MIFSTLFLKHIIALLPFFAGGLGSSGNGYYHGKFSFEAFSHKRAVNFKPCHYLFEYGGLRYVTESSEHILAVLRAILFLLFDCIFFILIPPLLLFYNQNQLWYKRFDEGLVNDSTT